MVGYVLAGVAIGAYALLRTPSAGKLGPFSRIPRIREGDRDQLQKTDVQVEASAVAGAFGSPTQSEDSPNVREWLLERVVGEDDLELLRVSTRSGSAVAMVESTDPKAARELAQRLARRVRLASPRR